MRRAPPPVPDAPTATLARVVAYLHDGGTVSTVALKRDLGLTLPELRAAFATQAWYTRALTPRTALLTLVYGPAIVAAYHNDGQPVRAIAQVYSLPVKDVHAVISACGARRARAYLAPETVRAVDVARVQHLVRYHGVRRAVQLLPYSYAQIRRLTPGVTIARGHLPTVDDTAIRSQYVAGATIRAIAQRTGVREKTVRRSLCRSRPLQVLP